MLTWVLALCLGSAILDLHEAYSCCPDGWLIYKNSCYLFADEQKMNWHEAVTYCNQRKSDLVSIETQNENRFLRYFASRLFKIDYIRRNITAFWIGATDVDIEGIWKWVATDTELTYTGWQVDGCLSKENTDVDNHEDCIALNGAYDFCWSDGLCNEGVGYALCEKTVTVGSSSGLQIIG